MRTVRFVLTVVLALVIAAPLLAGEGKKKKPAKPKAPAVFGPAQMVEGLTLTDDQKAQLEKIKQEYAPKLAEARKKAAEVLTPEQRQAEAEARKKAKEAGKTGAEAKEMVKAALKLTDEQQEKLAAALKEAGTLEKEARMKIMDLLTDEQKAQIKSKMKKKDK